MSEPMLFTICALGWVWLVARVVSRTIGAGSVGLPAAWLFAVSFMYGGAFVYALPAYDHLRPDGHWYLRTLDFTGSTVLTGLMASLLGLAGFALGCGAFAPRRVAAKPLPTRTNTAHASQLLWFMGGIAAIGLVLHASRVSFPMSAAILQVTRNMAVACVCLGAAIAVARGRPLWTWAMIGGLLPAYFLLVWGFVSYGFVVLTIYAGFCISVLRPRRLARWKLVLLGVATLYLLLMLFVAWMSFRSEIRGVIWTGGTWSARWAVLAQALAGIEWAWPASPAALDWINIRLNQTMMVGKVIERHGHHPELRQHGATLWVVLLAWVPRVLWPGKPEMGGSTFMAEHIGRVFSESSTFGVGPIIEFYVNFGYSGIFLGCVILGFCLRWLDRRAAMSLAGCDLFGFLKWFTIGVALIAPSSMMIFVAASAAMAYIGMTALGAMLRRPRRMRTI